MTATAHDPLRGEAPVPLDATGRPGRGASPVAPPRASTALDVLLAVCAVTLAALLRWTDGPLAWAVAATAVACALAVTWLPRRPHHGGADGSAGATPRSEVSGASTRPPGAGGATADPTP